MSDPLITSTALSTNARAGEIGEAAQTTPPEAKPRAVEYAYSQDVVDQLRAEYKATIDRLTTSLAAAEKERDRSQEAYGYLRAQHANACDQVAVLTARVERMEKALEPFAKALPKEGHYHNEDMCINFGVMNGNVTQTVIYGKLEVGDFWRAAAALQEKP